VEGPGREVVSWDVGKMVVVFRSVNASPPRVYPNFVVFVIIRVTQRLHCIIANEKKAKSSLRYAIASSLGDP